MSATTAPNEFARLKMTPVPAGIVGVNVLSSGPQIIATGAWLRWPRSIGGRCNIDDGAAAVTHREIRMRVLALALSVLTGLLVPDRTARAQSCKVCAEQQKACMKNYAGPACKTEYQMCLKSCKSR